MPAKKIPISFDSIWIMEGTLIATETSTNADGSSQAAVLKEQKQEEVIAATDPAPMQADPPQAPAAVLEPHEVMAKRIVIVMEARMGAKKNEVIQAKAMSKVYKRVRHDAAGPTAAPPPK